MNFTDNQINALGRGFLTNLNYLNHFNMDGNRCVSGSWGVSISVSTEDVLRILQPCFDNYLESQDVVKTFTIALRGSLIIKDENGNEILKL